MVIPGSSSEQTMMGPIPNATYQVSGQSSGGSGEEDFRKIFTIYGHGGHLGHETWTI